MMKGAVPSSRAKMLAVCAPVIAAAGILFVLLAANEGAARGTGLKTVTQSDYSVFGSSAVGNASASVPPSATAGEAEHPVAGTTTKVAVGNPNLNVLVAKSSGGGVCVSVERLGANGAGGSCAPAGLLKTGTTAQVHEANGEITVAGVVPDGVSAVTVGFADGTSETVPVAENGWAIEKAPAAVTRASDVVGG